MDIRAAVAPLIKWWWLILAAVLLAGGGSFYVANQQPPIYRSRATLNIGNILGDPNPTGGTFGLTQQLANAYVSLADREIVISAAMENLGTSWLPDFNVRTIPNSSLIQISVYASTPEAAQLVAVELTNQLIRLGPASVQDEELVRQSFINDQLDRLQIQIEETQAEQATLENSLGDLFSAREIDETQNQIRALEGKLNTLQRNFADLSISISESAPNILTIIEPANLPSAPLDSELVNTVVTAIVIAAALAVAGAYLLEYLDDSIKTEDAVMRATRLPVLASIAQVSPHERGMGRSRGAATDSLIPVRAATAESFRHLRTNVMFSGMHADRRVLLVASGQPNEGKSFVAANLARTLAQAEFKVLLIDADLRHPSQNEQFGMNNSNGLSNLMLALVRQKSAETAHKLLWETVRETDTPGLDLLTAGNRPPAPSELLSSPTMRIVLDAAEELYDFIIIDSAPCLPVTDAVALSTHVSGVLMVMRYGHTRTAQLQQSVNLLHGVNASVLGVVMNGRPVTSRQYGNYYVTEEDIANELALIDDDMLLPDDLVPTDGD